MTGIHPFHVLPVAVVADEIREPLPVDDFIWIDGSRPAVNHSDDENLPKQSVFQLGYCLEFAREVVNVHTQFSIVRHACLPMVLYASDSMTMSGWSSERPVFQLGYCLEFAREVVNVHTQFSIVRHACLPMVLYASDSMTMSGWSSERPTGHLRER